MGRVDGKTAIVTGAALGIGRAAGVLLAREGARVALTDILDEPGRSAAAEIKKAGSTAEYWRMDVSNEAEVAGVLAAVKDAFGGIDVLVNNAGIAGATRPTDQLTAAEWNQIFSINVNGVFFCTKHAIPYLKQAGGGSIINLSSIYGVVGFAGSSAYPATKGAVTLMTKSDALQYAPANIRVNSVHPGFIMTPMVEAYLREQGDFDQGLRDLAAAHPIGRVGEVDDVAYGILYLASDESRFVTGSELVIDGGYTAR
ncbi:MAG: glucose 1-dehydrogenase [Chloroflexi bacterium]|nr:glucose 1-dehydrogenase [Chloroflexota bacterium]